MKTRKIAVTAAAVLLVSVTILGVNQQAKAWEGNGWWWGGNGGQGCGYDGGCGGYHHWISEGSSCGSPGGDCCHQQYQNGWYIGQHIWDHDLLPYSPVAACCHPQFWNGFHRGYDTQWNGYNTDQRTSQGTSVNIYNSPGAYVSTNQGSSQGIGNVLKSIGQGLCNLAGGCSSGSEYNHSYGNNDGYGNGEPYGYSNTGYGVGP